MIILVCIQRLVAQLCCQNGAFFYPIEPCGTLIQPCKIQEIMLNHVRGPLATWVSLSRRHRHKMERLTWALGMYTAGIPIGFIVDAKGPRPGTLFGALAMGGGYLALQQGMYTSSVMRNYFDEFNSI